MLQTATPAAGEPSAAEPAPQAKKEDPMKLLPPTPMVCCVHAPALFPWEDHIYLLHDGSCCFA